MKIISAFSTAWKSFKGFVTKTDAYLVADAPKIQSAVQVGEKVVDAIDPAAAPLVTVFDSFEEAIVAEITAAFHTGNAVVNATSGAAVVTLSPELTALATNLTNILKGHPAVVAATA
jgi:hypothetical protein